MIRPENMRVDLLKENLAVSCRQPAFSWAIASDRPFVIQEGYRILLMKYGSDVPVADTGYIKSSASAGITIDFSLRELEADTVYRWILTVQDTLGEQSEPCEAVFITESAFLRTAHAGLWHQKQPDFCALRASFDQPHGEIYKVLVRAAACSPEPSRQYVYNLYVNGTFVCLGPARYDKGAEENTVVYYNSADITGLLREKDNVVSAVCYTSAEKAFFCEITAYFTDGSISRIVDTSEQERWTAADFTEVFRPSNSIGTFYYFAPAENLDAGALDRICWTPAAAVQLPYLLHPYPAEPVKRHRAEPEQIKELDPGVLFVDFGREFIGGLCLEIDAPEETEITVRCGEELENGRVKYRMRTGNVYEAVWKLKKGRNRLEELGMKTIRYAEFSGMPAVPAVISGTALYQEFDASASALQSDSPFLNRLYEFLKYSIMATNQDLYVDSQSRERCAYEGDVLINMLSAYAFSDDCALARFSASYLNTHRTWPAEYVLITLLLAREDYYYTGDAALLRKHYDLLKGKIFPYDTADVHGFYGRGILADGAANAVGTNAVLVDWPQSERDGYAYDESEYNTVLNCMACRALLCLSEIAAAIGQTAEAEAYQQRAELLRHSLITYCYDPEKGAFYDGLDSAHVPVRHYSQHATAYALYCGIWEGDRMKHALTDFLKGQNEIRMSVYGAFFLLEGLYDAGAGDYATELMLREDASERTRSWASMLGNGATITTEAWNAVTKPNMTFSHPWGSAPASQIVRGLFGIRPLEPGFRRFSVRIQAGSLSGAAVRVPTVKGPIEVSFRKSGYGNYCVTEAEITVPPNTEAELDPGNGKEIILLRSGAHRVRY